MSSSKQITWINQFPTFDWLSKLIHKIQIFITLFGIAFNKTKKYQEANEFFRKALQLQPNCFCSLYFSGIVLSKILIFDKAIKYY